MGIRFASKQCYEETTTTFFAEVLLNVTKLIDLDYGLFNNVFDPASLQKVYLRLGEESCPPVKALNAMKNLKSFHFKLETGSITAMGTILSDPKERLEVLEFRSKDVFNLIAGECDPLFDDPFLRYVEAVIGAWQGRNKEFELVSEVSVKDEDSNILIGVSTCTLSLLQEKSRH
jgi:hypothetical protein